jgi:hypothetical protein
MAASFLNFFSRFIVTDEFDPRLDPIPQLQALPPTEVIIDDVALSAAIAKKTERARGHNVEKFGTSDATIILDGGKTKFRNQHNRCAVSAVALTVDPSTLGFLSLDAIDPNLPHTAKNTQWVCLRLNLGKITFPDWMYRAWAHAAFRGVGQADGLYRPGDQKVQAEGRADAGGAPSQVIAAAHLSLTLAVSSSSLSFIRFSLPSCCAGKLHTTRRKGLATGKRLLRRLPPTNRRAG